MNRFINIANNELHTYVVGGILRFAKIEYFWNISEVVEMVQYISFVIIWTILENF